MGQITKVSDITAADLAEYLRIGEPTADDTETLNTMLSVAKSYVEKYTGRKASEIDEKQEMIIAIYVLVQDMWDNRTLYVEKGNLNHTVETILDLNSVNLLPTEGL